MSRLRVTVPKRFIHVEKVEGLGAELPAKVIPSGMLSTRTILRRKFGGAGEHQDAEDFGGTRHPPPSHRHASLQDPASPRRVEFSQRLAKRRKMRMKRARTAESNTPRKRWDGKPAIDAPK